MKNNKINNLLTIFLSVFLFTGCLFSDPKEANLENFSKAINQYLKSDKQKFNCMDTNIKNKDGYTTGSKKKNDKLAQQGIMISKIKKIEKKNLYYRSYNPKKFVDTKVYVLTDNAKPFYKDGSWGGHVCVGTTKLKEIVNFTIPKDMGGKTLSMVKYKYIVDDYPKWAKIPPKEVETKDMFILTNNGWVHSKLF